MGGFNVINFNVINNEHTRSPYHEAMELLPRVILAALAANLTIEFARMLIDINNALAAGVGEGGLPGYDKATPSQEGLALIFSAIAYGIVAILLVFQMLMRLPCSQCSSSLGRLPRCSGCSRRRSSGPARSLPV